MRPTWRAQPCRSTQRPIDLLFIGSMNERRRALIERIEAQRCAGHDVRQPARTAPERDDFITQAKAVFNCHFYDSSRFEQARVSHCLSLGTPVISERARSTRPHAAFEDSVFWVDERSARQLLRRALRQPAFADDARSRSSSAFGAPTRSRPTPTCSRSPPASAARTTSAGRRPLAARRASTSARARTTSPAGSTSTCSSARQPDLVLDLAQPQQLAAASRRSDSVGAVELQRRPASS